MPRLTELGPAAVDAVESDRIEDGVARWWAWGVLVIAPLGLVAVGVLLVVQRAAYVWLLKEDHPIEWGQFSILSVAFIVACVAAGRAAGRRDRLALAVAVVLAVGAFVVAGEEISWGQRVFALATPQDLSALNGQHELNIHDIRTGFPLEDSINFAEMLVAAGLTALSWFVRGPSPRLTSRVWRMVTPPLYATGGFAMMAAYRAVRFSLPRQFDALIELKQWMEFGLYLGILSTALSVAGSQRRQVRGRHRQSRSGQVAAPAISSQTMIIATALVGVLTAIFVIMTIRSGIQPG